MRAFILSIFCEISGLGVNPLPVIELRIVVALPEPPDKDVISGFVQLMIDPRLNPRPLECHTDEIPYELYLAGS